MSDYGIKALRTDADRPLSSFCGKPIGLDTFLPLAISITEALSRLHKQKIVHKRISPQHILINQESGRVSFADPVTPSSDAPRSGISRNFTTGHEAAVSPAYLSPEQLGKVNRIVDYRSDLYSLGVTFYELLTGRPPFQAQDLLEWVHCHFARIPKAPVQLVPAIPPVVSDIVVKLLAKTVEDRYQTVTGLKHDLVRCLAQYQSGRDIELFPLAEGDLSDQLLIPEKLYGREKDIDLLFKAYERVQKRGLPEMVMIAGYSGIGKTSLVGQLFSLVARERGFFIAGKFDQYRRNIPYSTIIEAFQILIRQLLTENEGLLNEWKTQLQIALGKNGQIIVDIFPQIELIIGGQPPVPELPPAEAENRFKMVLLQFLGVFSQKEHPLVIFLDDLQWADSASLRLIEHIITDNDTRYLLLIGAYRENEVTSTHPLRLSIETICNSQAISQTITLAPLSFRDLGSLIADTFHVEQLQHESFIRLVYEKTAGNPFFVIQFLMTMHSERLVAFNADKGCWQWDVERIRAKGYSDNVVDLMTAKLQKLPVETRETLRLGACIGNRFELSSVTAINGRTAEVTRQWLEEAMQEMLLVTTEADCYAFSHDRVQQAAYSLTPEEDRNALHLQIGRLMLQKSDSAAIGEKIFEIVNQLNLGAAFISERVEKIRVAGLDLIAGKKAKLSSAYLAALNYFSQGVSLLDEDCWKSDFDLSFNLYRELGEAEYLNSNYANSKKIVDLLLDKAKSDLQRAELYNILIIQNTLMAEYREAIGFGRKALSLLNVNLPENNYRHELGLELSKYREILGDREISSLVNDPEMTDSHNRVSLELLANMLVPARYSDGSLFALIAVITVNLSLKFGPTAKSTVGYTAFGMVLQSAMNNFQDGYKFGDLALRISERFNNPAQKCQTCLVLGHYLNHWVRHLKWADDFLTDGFNDGLAVGEMQWTGYTLAYKLFQPFYRGLQISLLQKELPALLSFTRKTKNQWATDTLLGLQLALSSLAGNGLSDETAFDHAPENAESSFMAECQDRKSFGALGRYAVLKVQIYFLFGQFEKALQAVAMAQELTGFFSSSISIAELNFFSSLVSAALFSGADEESKKQYLHTIAENQVMMRVWADHCGENFNHKYLLVEAECARLTGRMLDAEHFYEEAVLAAREHGFIQNEAIANELASRFYRDRGLRTNSKAYLKEARLCYSRWGAADKVRQLDQLYPQFHQEEDAAVAKAFGVQLGNLDAVAAIKASQAISGEIVLARLVETLMRTVLETGGAQKGVLLLSHGEDLVIEAEARVVGQAIKVSQPDHQPLESTLPVSLINYVKRTSEVVIVDDVSRQNMFAADEYVMKDSPVSMLGLPLLRQSKMIGMLYLENTLISGAFSGQRIAVLELLAAQAAISLENAALYQERSRAEQALRESEEKYRAIFEDSGTPLLFIEEDKTVSICNRAFEKLTGYDRAEWEGRRKWTELVGNPADLARMTEYHRLRRMDPLAAPPAYEFQLMDREGKLKDVVATVAMMRGTNKSLGALLDITEQKQAVEALHRSERKFRAIFDRSFQFMGLLTTGGTVIEVNETALEFVGAEGSAVVGQLFWETPWVSHSPPLQERMQAAIEAAAAGRFIRFEITIPSADGNLHYFDFSLKPVKDDAGNVVLIIPEARDITERKQAEEEQARLVAAIEQSAEAVIITDINFFIRYANSALEKLTGFTRDEIIGRDSRILSRRSHRKTEATRVFEVLAQGNTWSGRMFNQKKDGGIYEAEVTASPVRDKAGKIINYVSIHRDITKEVQLERELRQAHKMEAIGTLAGGIAHDFNNILAVIQGHTQLSTFKLPSDSPVQNSLAQILISCSRAKDMVNQILTFSRQADNEKRPVPLIPLVSEVLKLLRSSLPTTIEIDFDPQVTLEQSVIAADATQIHQVMMNLATNAAHAMGSQGGTLGVKLARSAILPVRGADQPDLPVGEYVVLSISDTGRGMDPSTLERIFDPYFTTKGPGEGSGMGLAVTQGIVKAHHGAIVVHSEQAVGTNFAVWFPASEEALAPDIEKKVALCMGSERILFVDDEPAFADIGKKMLESLGYRVDVQTSSTGALETFKAQPSSFDLVITDMTMPRLTGTELAGKMLAIRPDLAIILCTGFSEQVNARQSQALGIREFLMKPWDVSEMSVLIRKVLDQDKMKKA